ncbi:MAG: MBL fold metallo-hydrolase [Dehalococcoidia bacterium]
MSTAHIPTHTELPPPKVEEVSEGIFAYLQPDGSWGLNNTGFIVGRDGVTAVDTCFTESRTRALLEAIRKVTELPLRTLVNTHHHGDHTHGNYLLPAATIIGHEKCRQMMLEGGLPTPTSPIGRLFPGVQWGDLKLAVPFVTFEDHLNIYVDDLKLEAIFVGPAHTTNDVILWVPERRLLFSGDLIFHQGTPFVAMGSVAGSLKALETLRSLGAKTIVPGHGPVCGPEVIDDMVGYLRFVQEVARCSFEANLTPLETAREAELGRFAHWHDTERLAGNLHRAYSEIKGEPLGTELDLRPVIADMIAYNGGRPLRCLA